MKQIKNHQKLPTKWEEREALRDKGQFWTPAWVADAMIAYVAQDTDLVFDPATGRGAFWEALMKLDKTHTLSFWGTDVDTAVLSDSIYQNNNCIVEQRDFIKNPPDQKFKAIVANPPYIRHHRIDEVTKTFLKQLSLKRTGLKIDGRAGYHIYFLIQALNLLAPEGRLAFIMPSDTCEGKFATNLWKWITDNYCLECVVTFGEKATPFPNVDTNAMIFFIKNTNPTKSHQWIKATESYTNDLLDFVLSDFTRLDLKTLEIVERETQEGITTGLSRPVQQLDTFKYHLHDFAKVMRGIATGSNEFFFLTAQQAEVLHLPNDFLKRAIGRTKDVSGDAITIQDLEQLDAENRPTYLFSINGQTTLPPAVSHYLKVGEQMGLPDRALIRQRNPWYKMEQRAIPPLLFAYLGRRNTRFIKNEAGVLPLTGFLCVYPIYEDETFIQQLWQVLNHPDTLANLILVGKSYGSGAIKVEPSNLSKLPIPEHLVEQFHLKRPYQTKLGQLEIFREQ